jgi:Zn-dependent peptidase ImmA (M78 family)
MEPPVDVRAIAEKEGLDYDEVDFFPDDVDALITPLNGRIVAVVNKNHSLNRRRFSLAHELYHYLEGEILVLEDHSTTGEVAQKGLTRAGKDPFEVEADTFAGDLLVPKSLSQN